MSWIDRLEKHCGWLAVPGLTKGIALLTAVAWVMTKAFPQYEGQLVLLPAAVYAGEWWRLFSFVFVPLVNDTYFGLTIEYSNGIWLLFSLLFLWFVGNVLEQEWGAFRLTLYILIGYLGTVVSALWLGIPGTFLPISMALFFALATLVPDYQILLFFIIPVRIKWIALLVGGMLVLSLIFGAWSTRGSILLCYANYLLYFGPSWLERLQNRRETAARRNRFDAIRREAEREMPTMHACAVCGRTEVTNPELEFRVSSVDEAEYCREHLPKANP